MIRQSLVTQIARVLLCIVLDLLDMLAHLAVIALLAFALGLVLPIPVALVVALLAVCTYSGYRTARRVDRARMRGEIR
ncbi:hypothetical protein [Streptosporangium sp. V21-05]|uniref:hypothetical protein n=1 Tax=Streptosporangium sp. V21-05 TaxID=3446115 RepID=UPI003F533BBA